MGQLTSEIRNVGFVSCSENKTVIYKSEEVDKDLFRRVIKTHFESADIRERDSQIFPDVYAVIDRNVKEEM